MRGSYSHMLLKVEMITITPDNPLRHDKGVIGFSMSVGIYLWRFDY